MSDETVGGMSADNSEAPNSVNDEQATTPVFAEEAVVAGAAESGSEEPGDSADSASDSDADQMPPLDEIDVPGAMGLDTGRNARGNSPYSAAMGELKPGEVVQGTVVHIDSEGVLVDVGTKSEGLVRPGEWSRDPVASLEEAVQVGDKVDVLVMEPEARDGNLLLSKKRADFEKAWDRVQEALRDGQPVQAMVSDRVRGGLVVDLGIRGFVPASHVGNGKLKNLEKFVGQSLPLKVLEVDRHNRKVVLSHRLATEEERRQQKEETLHNLEEGQVRTGVVRRITDYGAFVDLGGVDGLLHVSEMGWTRVKHPGDILKVGQEIQVMILRLNLDQGRISLGMRQILPDPWTTVGEHYNVGDVVQGEVTRLVPFGAFVLLEGDLEGIIPNSEMAHRRIAKPSDVVAEGQQVEVKVIDIRSEERRMTLSLRALQPRDAVEEYPAAPRGGAPGEEAPAPDAAGGTGRRERRERRGRGRGFEEEGAAAGGDFSRYMTSRVEPRVTLGDMFGDMFSGGGGGSGSGGKTRGGGGSSGGGRRRRGGEEDEDFEDLEDLEDLDTDLDAAGEPVESIDSSEINAANEANAAGEVNAVAEASEPGVVNDEATAEEETES